jgi:hypothetical protein
MAWDVIAFNVGSFVDAAILLLWGYQHIKHQGDPASRRDGLMLVALGLCTIVTWFAGHEGERKRAAAEQKLEAKLKDRTLDEEQWHRIGEKLKPFTHQVAIVGASPLSSEALGLATNIYISLKMAFWVSEFRDKMDLESQRTIARGVMIRPLDPRGLAAGKALADALKAENIEVSLWDGPYNPSQLPFTDAAPRHPWAPDYTNVILVVVGDKP